MTKAKQWGLDCEAAIRHRLFPPNVHVIPSDVLDAAGRRSGNKWHEWLSRQPDRLRLLTEAEYLDGYGPEGHFRKVLENLQANEAARRLLLERRKRTWQLRIVWPCPRTGVDRKGELDCVFWKARVVIDIKTARNPTPVAFKEQMLNLCYDVQAVTYLEGIELFSGKDGWRFCWVVIRNKPPYDVWVYEDSPGLLQYARWRADAWMDELIDRAERDDWFPAGWGMSIPIEAPT